MSLISIFLSACDQAEMSRAKAKLKKIISVVFEDDKVKPPQKEAQVDQKKSQDLLNSKRAKKAKENSELLREVFEVVYMQVPENPAEFGDWVDTLNQGASFEGVYNGFTHSSRYRKFESTHPGASPTALKVFSAELAYFAAQLETPTQFDKDSANPLPLPVEPKGDLDKQEMGDGVDVLDFSQKNKVDNQKKNNKKIPQEQLKEKYISLFVGASIFTLKRVLADEALKVMEYKSEYPEKFALWYSLWAVRMAEYEIDFGLKQRHSRDDNFHYKWALKADSDRLKWEVLNRVHRILNESNQPK